MASNTCSDVWEHMVKNKNKKDSVDCSLCNSNFICKDGSTTSLRRHLTTKHGILLTNKRHSDSGGNSQTQSQSHSLSQPKLKQFIKSKEMLQKDSPRASAITKKVVKMICKDMQPLSVIEDVGFKELIHECEPRYAFPFQAGLHLETILSLDLVRMQMQPLVLDLWYKSTASNPNACCSLTTDGWTSRNPISYVTYTLHMKWW